MTRRSGFRMSWVLVLLLLAVRTVAATHVPPLLVGAFNVQVFGDSKSSKPAVMERLVAIVRRYDLLLVQEVRDVDGSAIAQLLREVNAEYDGAGFKLLLGERLGRTNSKEQYAWFYREAKVRPADFAVSAVPDPEDTWEREPMLVYWDTTPAVIKPTSSTPSSSESAAIAVDARHILATLGIHVDPDEAVMEIDALVDPVDKALAGGRAGLGILVMGDLNADCSYVTKTEWACIREESCSTTRMRLWNPDKYVWLLNDTVDTTTSNTHCAYDRFVFAPPAGEHCADPLCGGRISGVGIYDFQAALGLTQEEAKDVSDHFPIELRMRLNDPEAEESERDDVDKTSEGERRWTFMCTIAAVVIAMILLESKGRDLCVIQFDGDLN